MITLPGLIDIHVHLHTPGVKNWDLNKLHLF